MAMKSGSTRSRPARGRRRLTALILVLPLLATVGTVLVARSLLARAPLDLPAPIEHLLLLAVAIAGAAAAEVWGRRRLPLVILLELALGIRDEAPRKLAAALRATSPKHLREAAASGDVERAHAASVVIDLTRILTTHDRLTRGHSERVSAISTMLADEMGISGAARNRLQWAALLHDVGKINVSASILNKPSRPNQAEWAELQRHPASGAAIAVDVATWLDESAPVIEQHHERFDGTGYPNGLRGTEISMAARIVAVADAFEVMTGSRTYQTAMSPAQARAELVAGSGSHFDPLVVRAFASLSVARLYLALGPTAWVIVVLIVGG